MNESGLRSYVSEGAVAIVFEEMRGGLLAWRKTFQPPAVHEKNIEPTVVIVVVKCHAATGRLEQVFVLVLAAIDRFSIESSLAPNIDECRAKRVLRRRR